MTSDVFVRHYTAVADASPVPVLLYNFTAVDRREPAAGRGRAAGAHPNIVGMKESGGDVAQIADLVSLTPADFTVLAGSAATLLRRAVRRRGGRHPRARRAAARRRACGCSSCHGAGSHDGGARAAARARAAGAAARRGARRARPEGGARICSATTSACRGRRCCRCPSRPSPRCARRWRTSRKFPHEPAARHRSHPARPRPEPDRAARHARDGGADRQPSRSADDGAARRRARAAGARVPRGRRVVRVRRVRHRHVRDGNGGREPRRAGHARARGRHRLLRRSARADVRALRRDGDAARRRVGHARAIPRRCGAQLADDAGRHRRDGARGDVDRRAEPGRASWRRSRASTTR